MCQLGGGDEGPAWSWRRSLFAWEEEVVRELKLLLHNVTLQVNKADMWLLNLETSHDYSVRSAYNLLTVQPPAGATVACTSIWNKDVPLKVVLFAWRLFRDRLPTKDDLLRRGVIPNDSRMCVARCGSEETSNHLLLHCPFFGSVWHYISRWMGMSTVTPLCVGGHFNQFTFVGSFAKARRAILHVLWYATAWEIWKERNNKLFKGTQCPIVQVVDKIKSLSFMWLNAKFPSLPFNYHGWWFSPFTILGIG